MRVLANKALCPEYHLITLRMPGGFKKAEPKPGQFFHLACDPVGTPVSSPGDAALAARLTLRRPFSIHRIHYDDFDRRILAARTIIPPEIRDVTRRSFSEFDIMYKLKGVGTRRLSQVKKGQRLSAIGPLGNGFRIDGVKSAILVAGGIGAAPLMALAEKLRYRGVEVVAHFGALKREHLVSILRGSRAESDVDLGFGNGIPDFSELIVGEFREMGVEQVVLSTEDGKLGRLAREGLVTATLGDHLKALSRTPDETCVFACGPPGMMQEVAKLTRRYGVPCQVLLEERMGCGVGACLSCTCRVQDDDGRIVRKRVCVDGPVFDAARVRW